MDDGRPQVYKDELTLYTGPSGIVPTLTFLRDHQQCQYKQLIDISGVDYPTRAKRFEVVYHLLSIQYASRLRVKTYADEVSPVPSVSGVFRSADWYPPSLLRLQTQTESTEADWLIGTYIGSNVRCTTCMACSSRTIPT
jgi:hypothetical protein